MLAILKEQTKRGRLKLSFLLFAFSFFPIVALAHNGPHETGAERIENFDVTLTVNADSTVRVREAIRYDFGTLEKHGIFRDIPVKYAGQFGTEARMPLTVESVTDENENPYPFELSTEGANRRIKIGDAEKTVSGSHTYVLTYTVRSVIGYFEGYDELYWNVTGNAWPVPIKAVSMKLVLPEGAPWKEWRLACYFGAVGSTASCGTKEGLSNRFESDEIVREITLHYSRSLAAGEGVTLAVGFPKGMVKKPTLLENIFFFLRSNPLVFLPLIVFITMFRLWYVRGRDPEGRGVIIPEYDLPEKLSLLEIAGLMKGKVGGTDITAAMIDLAVRGYLTIEKTIEDKLLFDKEDYVFHRLGKTPPEGSFEEKLLSALFTPGLSSAEQRAAKGLLGSPFVKFFPKLDQALSQATEAKIESEYRESVKLSELKNKFYAEIPKLEEAVLSVLVTKGYFSESPKKVLGKYFIIGFFIFFFLLFFGFVHSGIGIASVLLSALIYFVFAWLMPRVTKAGAVMKEYILGLKDYLQIAEKNRLEFHNAPEKTPALFEKLLPAAMLLGVTAIWAKEFESLSMRPPEWYHGPAGSSFSAVSFGSDLNSFSSAASSTLASAPGGSSGSGGGGFSGGGGGGGGGGSW